MLRTQSQTNSLFNYSVDYDLLSSTVYYSLQDKNGYLWFATDNGVSRFDGYKFKNFTTADGLITNTVFNLYEDYKGRIWFISFNGKLTYYYNNQIHEYKYNNIISYEKNGILTPPRSGFFIDHNDKVYISFNEAKTMFVIDSLGNSENIKTPKDNIRIFVKNNTTTLNTIAPRIKAVIVNKDSITTKYTISDDVNEYSHTSSKVKNNELIFNNKKYVYSIKDNKIKLLYTNDNTIYFVKFAKKNNSIWIGTNTGIINISRNINGDIIKIDTLLNSYKISSITEDNEEGIWYTSLNNGIFYKPKSDIHKLNNKLVNIDITDIYYKNNKIYLSTYSNKYYIIENGVVNEYQLPKYVFIISSIKVRADSALIIATPNTLFIKKNNKLSVVPKANTIKNTIFSNNKLFIGKRSGLYLYNENKKGGSAFKLILQDWVNSSFNLNDSIIIISGKHGAYRVNNKTLNYTKLNIDSTQHNIVTAAKYKDYLLFGTKDIGLIFYKNNKIHAIINEKNGLSSSYIRDIEIYGDYIWIATNKGMNLLNIKNNNIKTPIIQSFFTTNGLISNTVNVLKIVDSILYIGTNKGISYLNISDFKPKKYIPNIQISSVTINKKDTTVLNKYILNSDENNISIDFISISYNYQKKIKYKYRFRSSREPAQWLFTKNSSINLVELNYGNYVFEVYSVINNIESKTAAIINIIIKPPFWDTILFKVIVYIIISVILGLIFLLIIKRNKQKNTEKLNLYKYQNQALINQINPHFIFNTLNSIQLYIYKNEKLKSADYITKFAKLMRQVLDYSKTELITISEEINVIESYVELERLRFDNKFDFKLNVDNKILFTKILPLITQPYIENAIWHGLMLKETKGLLEIFIYEHEGQIIIAIDDNGIGREKAKEINMSKTFKKTSYGQSIGEERMNVFNKVYKTNASLEIKDIITDNIVAGTRVLIKFPKLR